jgi:hypothetical protein
MDVLNRGRRSLAVDLKQPDGAEIVLRAAAWGGRADRGLPALAWRNGSVWALTPAWPATRGWSTAG